MHGERHNGDDRCVPERVRARREGGEDVGGPGEGPGQDEDLPDVFHRRFLLRVGPDGPDGADGPAVGAGGGVVRGMASAAVDAAVTAITVLLSPLSMVELLAVYESKVPSSIWSAAASSNTSFTSSGASLICSPSSVSRKLMTTI